MKSLKRILLLASLFSAASAASATQTIWENYATDWSPVNGSGVLRLNETGTNGSAYLFRFNLANTSGIRSVSLSMFDPESGVSSPVLSDVHVQIGTLQNNTFTSLGNFTYKHQDSEYKDEGYGLIFSSAVFSSDSALRAVAGKEYYLMLGNARAPGSEDVEFDSAPGQQTWHIASNGGHHGWMPVTGGESYVGQFRSATFDGASVTGVSPSLVPGYSPAFRLSGNVEAGLAQQTLVSTPEAQHYAAIVGMVALAGVIYVRRRQSKN